MWLSGSLSSSSPRHVNTTCDQDCKEIRRWGDDDGDDDDKKGKARLAL